MDKNVSVGNLIIEYYNRNRENDITINPNNKDVTFRDFLNMDYETVTVTFTEKELETAIMYSSKIKIEEILKALHIKQFEFDNIFNNLKLKISAPKFCSKKYIANRIRKIFPNEICYKILEKYNLAEISAQRHGINQEDKYLQNQEENRKENLSDKDFYNTCTQKEKDLIISFGVEMFKKISDITNQNRKLC